MGDPPTADTYEQGDHFLNELGPQMGGQCSEHAQAKLGHRDGHGDAALPKVVKNH